MFQAKRIHIKVCVCPLAIRSVGLFGTSFIVSLVWTPCRMHRCVCIWQFILQNYNYKLHFQNLFIYDISHVSIRTLVVENLDVCNIQLTMGIDQRWQIYPNVVQCLTLTLVDCHRKCHSNRKLTTTQNKWWISPEEGHDDGGYEYTFADIVPYDDLRFIDTLTQSFDNQSHTIAQSYWLIKIAQQKDWHAHFEFEVMICDIVELQNVQKFH